MYAEPRSAPARGFCTEVAFEPHAPLIVSAPGKLFLLGEYAVLEGAPALLTAVDRRVQVTIEPSHDARWRVSAPNLGIRQLQLGSQGALPDSLDATSRAKLRVFDAVRQAVLVRAAHTPEPLAITIDSGAFSRNGYKLGLGSSAAVAAALTLALARAAQLALDRAALCRLAIQAHRNAQNGAGSGGDVATAVYGGLLHYVRDRQPVALTWPADLAGMVVITGTGASTTDLVGRVADYAARDEAGYRADIERLAQLAGRARAALSDATGFMRLAAAYFDALIALDAHAQAGIVNTRHHALRELAARHGGVFKTAGAGGGDVGLAFSHRGESAHQLAAAFARAGAAVVPLELAAPGLDETTR